MMLHMFMFCVALGQGAPVFGVIPPLFQQIPNIQVSMGGLLLPYIMDTKYIFKEGMTNLIRPCCGKKKLGRKGYIQARLSSEVLAMKATAKPMQFLRELVTNITCVMELGQIKIVSQ